MLALLVGCALLSGSPTIQKRTARRWWRHFQSRPSERSSLVDCCPGRTHVSRERDATILGQAPYEDEAHASPTLRRMPHTRWLVCATPLSVSTLVAFAQGTTPERKPTPESQFGPFYKKG